MGTGHRFLYDDYKAERAIRHSTDAATFDLNDRSGLLFEIVTAAAETRTVPAPLKAGIEVGLILYTDGGDCTVTVTNGYNNDNDTILVLEDAGDYVHLRSVNVGGTLRWRVMASQGVVGVLPVDADYDPSNRVFARAEVSGRIYSKAVISDWSLFKSAASANMDFVLSGSGGFGASAASDGGVALSHSANSSTFAFIKPRQGSRMNTIHWSSSKSPRFRAVIKTGTITSQKLMLGFTSGSSQPDRFIGPGGSGPSNRAYFFVDQPTNASWKVDVAGGGTSSTSGDCGTAAASSTVYDLELRVNSSRIVTAYINGALVYTSTQALAASKRLTPMIGVQTEDNASNGLSVYHVLMSQNISA